jgi:biotin operon repressor
LIERGGPTKGVPTTSEMTAAQADLDDVIFALQANLTRLEQGLSEICELKEKVFKKERELEKAIAQNKAALEEFGRSQKGFNDLVKRNQSADQTILDEREDIQTNEKNRALGLQDIDLKETCDSDIVRSLRAHLTSSQLLIDETMTADQMIQSWSETLRSREGLLQESLKKIKSEQDRLSQEITEGQRTFSELEQAIKERKQQFQDCEAENVALREQKHTLETELDSIGQSYCDLNEDLTERSPVLLKYLGLVNQLSKNAAAMGEMDSKMTKLICQNQFQILDETREKLQSNQESIALLFEEEEKFLKESRDSQSDLRILETGRDLIVAMRWGKWASRGLYQPNASTAPLMLLLFEQYCRQQVPFKQINVDQIADAMKMRDFSRSTCPGSGNGISQFKWATAELNIAKYVAAAAREVGYTAGELRCGGCPIEEICRAGYSLQEMKDSHFTVEEIRSGGWSVHEICSVGYSLKEMKSAGISAGDLRALGYSVMQLKEVCYLVEELRSGGYSLEEIQKAGYSVPKMRRAGVLANELRQLGYTARRLKQVGYTFEELRSAGYDLKSIL